MIKRIAAKIKHEYIKHKKSKMNIEKIKKYVKEVHEAMTGHTPNLENPTTYTEKMLAFKISDVALDYADYADKYVVRAWVAEQIGADYLIPLIGAWDRVRDIPLDQLPNEFILKANHSSGQNFIVEDKKTLNLPLLKMKLFEWLQTNYFHTGLERQYFPIAPKILAEELIASPNEPLWDYRFFCFNGTVELIVIGHDDQGMRYLNVYDRAWNELGATYGDYPVKSLELANLQGLEVMVEIAEQLAQKFPHVRVDLYNVDGKIYFGELTFTPASGNTPFRPAKLNEKLGQRWHWDQTLEIQK